jgi:hypothetical protein
VVGRIIALVFIVLFFGAGDAVFIRAAWLSWSHPDRAPNIGPTRSSNPSVQRGHERGILAFALFWLFMGLFLVLITVNGLGLAEAGQPTLLGKILGISCLTASLGFCVLHQTVAWFNRPTFLAPPHRRDEIGSIVEWRRHRKDTRNAGAKTQKRDPADPG